MQGTRRPRDGYTVSKCKYDVCEPCCEGVTFVVGFRNRFWYTKFGICYILHVKRTQIKGICYFKEVLYKTQIYNASYEIKQKVLSAIVKIYFTVIIVLAVLSLQNHLVLPWNRTSLWCKIVTEISSNLSTFLAPNYPCPLMVNIQQYSVISPCPWNEVRQVVVSGRMSQSDVVVKYDTSCDFFPACLWSLRHGRQQNSECQMHFY